MHEWFFFSHCLQLYKQKTVRKLQETSFLIRTPALPALKCPFPRAAACRDSGGGAGAEGARSTRDEGQGRPGPAAAGASVSLRLATRAAAGGGEGTWRPP